MNACSPVCTHVLCHIYDWDILCLVVSSLTFAGQSRWRPVFEGNWRWNTTAWATNVKRFVQNIRVKCLLFLFSPQFKHLKDETHHLNRCYSSECPCVVWAVSIFTMRTFDFITSTPKTCSSLPGIFLTFPVLVGPDFLLYFQINPTNFSEAAHQTHLLEPRASPGAGSVCPRCLSVL